MSKQYCILKGWLTRPLYTAACTCKCKPGPFRAACRYLLLSAWLVLNHRRTLARPRTFSTSLFAMLCRQTIECLCAPKNPELHEKLPKR